MAVLRSPKLVLFGEILNSEGDVSHVVEWAAPDTTVQCSSDHIHERAIHMLEKDKSADKQERDNDGADRHHAEVGHLFTKQCPAKPLDDSGASPSKGENHSGEIDRRDHKGRRTHAPARTV